MARSEIISIKLTESGFFLRDVCSGFWNIPSGGFPESMPKIVEGREIAGFYRDHSVVCGPPDVGILRDYLHVFGQVLLEALPVCGSLLLISLSKGPYPVEDQECEYQRTTPWLALNQHLG